jgi:hypothetical protein
MLPREVAEGGGGGGGGGGGCERRAGAQEEEELQENCKTETGRGYRVPPSLDPDLGKQLVHYAALVYTESGTDASSRKVACGTLRATSGAWSRS